MQSLLNESQLRGDEFERAAMSRQRELDNLLLGVKKLRETEEVLASHSRICSFLFTYKLTFLMESA